MYEAVARFTGSNILFRGPWGWRPRLYAVARFASCVIVIGMRDVSYGPGVRGVEDAVDGFASRDVDAAGAFVIHMLVEGRPAVFDT